MVHSLQLSDWVFWPPELGDSRLLGSSGRENHLLNHRQKKQRKMFQSSRRAALKKKRLLVLPALIAMQIVCLKK